VAPHGLYIELPNTVEGLLRLTSLPEGDYDVQPGVSVTERLSGKRLRVGDAITIEVAAANVSAGQIDFVLPQED
jgi:ribonuclease R